MVSQILKNLGLAPSAVAGAGVLLAASFASANVSIIGGGATGSGAGWDVPPALLGGWNMTQYDNFDPFLSPGDTTSLASSDPFSTHTASFANPTTHFHVGSGWASWSGGYDGSVYFAGTSSTAITLTMSPGTVAFSLFFESNAFSTFDYQIAAFDNLGNVAMMNQTADGFGGATWAGAFTDGSTFIESVRVQVIGDGSNGIAVGRFGYAIPTPGAIAMLGFAGIVGARRRRA
ncbi:MAG: hypothetical protein KF724_05625 [Phycisphaeraceae bacterium]|nr:hypothetical protein [Phycisphaeraceae bacterium]